MRIEIEQVLFWLLVVVIGAFITILFVSSINLIYQGSEVDDLCESYGGINVVNYKQNAFGDISSFKCEFRDGSSYWYDYDGD